MLRLPQKKPKFPGKVSKYRHMEEPLKVICLDGLFHAAVDQVQNKRYKIFKLYDPS